MGKSDLAATLCWFIDGEYYDRSQVAKILGVKLEAVDAWLNDQDIPSAVNMRSMWSLFVEDTRFKDQDLERFYDLIHRPSLEVSPHGNRMFPTIREYMVGPVLDGFLGTLKTIPPHIQEQLLYDTGAMVREIRENYDLDVPGIKEIRYNKFQKHIDELNRKASGKSDG